MTTEVQPLPAEQILETAIQDSQKTLGASIPRLITQKPQIAMNAIKNQLNSQRLFLPVDELASYLAVGLEIMQFMRPVGIFEIQTVQRIIDTNWALNRAIALESNLYNAGIATQSQIIKAAHPDIDDDTLMLNAQAQSYRFECADIFEKLGRQTTRMQRSLKLMRTDFNDMVCIRIPKRGDKYNAETCPARAWYLKLSALADKLIEARQELKEKSTPVVVAAEPATHLESATSSNPLFCKNDFKLASPPTPEESERINLPAAA